MGPSLDRTVASYRLLYVQPDPENGERICIGLVLQEAPARYTLLYDRDFRRVRCVAPDLEFELLAFYLQSLEATLRDTEGSGLEMVMAGFGPHLVTSIDRQVAAPITDSTKMALLSRFAGVRPKLEAELTAVAAESRPETSASIAAFVQRLTLPLNLRVHTNVRPDQLLGGGHKSAVKKVAIAIEGRSQIILVDGVDLNEAPTPRTGIARTNDVVHKFWQYNRLRNRPALSPFKTVGVVMNGALRKASPRKKQAFAEVHDYALDQFGQEADIAVDSGVTGEKLSAVLASEANA